MVAIPETNIAPENRPLLEKEIPIGKPPFLQAMLVHGPLIRPAISWLLWPSGFEGKMFPEDSYDESLHI